MKNEPTSSPADMSRKLRQQALSVTASELNVAPTRDLPHVFGILMETAYPEAVVSLVAFTDGSTSLYFSGGGGIIGAGEHDSVRAALAPFFQTAEANMGSFTAANATPFPEPGRVRFYLRTYEGTLTAEADEDDLGEMRHPLSPLFHAGHDVITAVREATPD
jgi:hypothetical protein